MDGVRRQDQASTRWADKSPEAAPPAARPPARRRPSVAVADGFSVEPPAVATSNSATSAPTPAGDMGRVQGPRVRLGPGPRRVTGNDLAFVQALVSQNDQTIADLSALRPANPATPTARAERGRPARRYVTEGPLDRLNRWLGECLEMAIDAGKRHLTQWVEPWVARWRAQPSATRQSPRQGGQPTPSRHARPTAPRRAA